MREQPPIYTISDSTRPGGSEVPDGMFEPPKYEDLFPEGPKDSDVELGEVQAPPAQPRSEESGGGSNSQEQRDINSDGNQV